MSKNQKIQHTSQGEEILIRASRGMLIGQTVIQLIWVFMVVGLLMWTGSSILAFFDQKEIIGPAKLLDRFELSPRAFYAAMVGWCVFLVWFGLGGLYEIVKVHLQRDRFILRPEAWIVRRSVFFTREITINSYDQVALRLRGDVGLLEAKTKSGWRTLTENGTVADRQWLLKLLQDRYRTPTDLPITEATKERMGIYMVDRTPDGRVKIESTKASTIGCAAISGVLCLAFFVSAVWAFAKGSGSGVILIFFAVGIALGGLSALNRRMVEASRGRLRVQWSSPVGQIASRFVSKDNFLLKYEFGEGSYMREGGTLKLETTHFGKNNTPKQTIVLRQDPSQPELDADGQPLDLTEVEQDIVLKVHGHGSEETAKDLLRILSEATGFPSSSAKG